MSILDWFKKKPQDEEVDSKRFKADIRVPTKDTGADWKSFYTEKVRGGFTPYGWKRDKSGSIQKKMFYVPNPQKQKQEREQLKQEYMKYLAGKYGKET